MRERRFRYGPWRGGTDPLAPPFDVRAAVDRIAEDVMRGSDVRDAVDRLLRHGTQERPGLDELRRRIAEQRERMRRRGDLAGTLDQVRAALDQALAYERDALDAEGPEADLDRMNLDTLPDDTASAVQQLADYDWHSDEAREIFDGIRQMLQREVLDAQFKGIKNALQGGDPEAMQRVRDMLADLNALLAAHARGEDTTEQFERFMRDHGEFFPENPRDTDELIDALAQRQAAAESMMRSLSPQQRAELQDLMRDALGDDVDLQSQMAQLQDNLQTLRPGMLSGARPYDVDGDEPLGYGDAVSAISDLADLEQLEAQLAQDYGGANLDDVDVEALERQLGPSAVRDLSALDRLQRELERQGYVSRDAGALTLTPKALRRIAETALQQVLGGRNTGDHRAPTPGSADERTGAILPWEVGDERPIDAVATVRNAVVRSASAGSTLTLEPDDLAVAETEERARAAVALCVDLSFSMVQQDRWAPMKQTALALSHLVSTRFRTDALEVIGFARTARRLDPSALATIEPSFEQGTNLQHALMLASAHVRRHPQAEPVVLIVTDGEPTAHLEPDGEAYFDWPTSEQTIRATVREVDAMTRMNVPLSFFLLGDDPGLERFVNAVARRNGGRVLSPELGDLGSYVVHDYLRSRRR